MTFTYVAVAFVVFATTEVFVDGNEKEGWTKAINKLLKKHLEDYKNAEAHANDYEADGHRLEPGKTVIVGREAIKYSFREEMANKSMAKIEMTDLRFWCGDGAVAETRGYSGIGWGKGVILVKMVDGVAKISTLIYNTDN